MADTGPFSTSTVVVGTCIAWEYQLPAVDGWTDEIAIQLKKGAPQSSIVASASMTFEHLDPKGQAHRTAQHERTQHGRSTRQPCRVKITIACQTNADADTLASVVQRLRPVTAGYWVDEASGKARHDPEVQFYLSDVLQAATAAAK